MPTIYLVSAVVGDHVPGRELADPDCPDVSGLLEHPDVAEWIDGLGYNPDNPDELVYLVAEDEADNIPDGFDWIVIDL